tara:strand:+ start:2851 stop:3021 length:171 start_codon:yes stop_codon:yes gene_type:complete
VYKEIFVKGHYRKGGIFVGPHIRKIKIKGPKNLKGVIKSYNSIDPNQLTFNFSGKT